MKNAIRVIVAVLTYGASMSAIAQDRTGQVATDVYFEDAIGNRDTVKIGWTFDSAHDSQLIIDSLGEENLLGIPFDSVFEVRVSDGVSYRSEVRKMSKVFYSKVRQSPFILECPYSFGAHIFLIHARHPPVTVTWDTSFFCNDLCIAHTTLVNHDIWVESLPDPEIWYAYGADKLLNICMSEDSSAILDLEPIPDTLGWTEFTYDFELNNGETVTHGAYAIIPIIYNSLFCSKVVTSTDDTGPPASRLLFPNPVSDVLHVDGLNAGAVLTVLGLDGGVLLRGSGHSVDVSGLSAGPYLLRIEDNDGVLVEKFLKW